MTTTRRYAAQVAYRQANLLRQSNALAGRVDEEVATTFRAIVKTISKADTFYQQQQAIHSAQAKWATTLRKLPTMLADGIEDAVAESTIGSLKDLAHELGRAFSQTQEASKPKPRIPLAKAFRQEDIDKRLSDLTVKRITQAKARQLATQNAWRVRLAAQTKLATPDEIGRVIQDGLARKKTVDQIARDLRPKLQGVASTANRIARHETMWAAHRANLESWEQLGTLVVAYQVHSQRDSRVRPAHAKRDGNIYWKKPKGNQRPLSKMPHPPYEADGSIAYNCRCFVSPILDVNREKIETEQKQWGPLDREVMSGWFDKAPADVKIAAVGSNRYNSVRRILGRTPTWQDFTNNRGRLLDMPELRNRHAA